MDSLRSALGLANIGKAHATPTSPYGFSTFFKNPNSAVWVWHTLYAITAGDRIPIDGQDRGPVIFCANEETRSWRPEILALCEQVSQSSSAFYIGGKISWVVLCPDAFIMEQPPVKPTYCPTITPQNSFDIRNWYRSDQTSAHLAYTILHELIHHYHQSQSLSMFSNPPEAVEINDCARMAPEAQRFNPENYLFFIYCMSSPSQP